jgi:hypothetical protein
MRDIARLLFGDEAGGLSGLFGDGGGGLFGDGDWSGMAGHARRAGEWCGSTPGGDSAAGAARGLGRGAAGAREIRRTVIIRESRPR